MQLGYIEWNLIVQKRVMAQSRIVEYRGVVIIGKAGAGKSTVANTIVNKSRFKVLTSFESCTKECEHCIWETTDEAGQFYRMRVMDTVGLFDTHELTDKATIAALKKYMQDYFPDGINLIIFVLKVNRFTHEENAVFEFIRKNFCDDISVMSALAITHCENMDEDARCALITEFRDNEVTKPIAEFMKAGIFTVGFPSCTKFPPGVKSYYEDIIAKDKKKLQNLAMISSKARLSKELNSDAFWLCTIL